MILILALQEGFIFDDTKAINATHIKADETNERTENAWFHFQEGTNKLVAAKKLKVEQK
ncbi:hypothetical protein MHI27_22435 [Paenibacillus sp. FSL H8-0261]|uniref:hypothetical protein n=1 Tax=Paenibacillus sp. FSL H8-0261 TaxID=2921381 RepID=UPI003251D22B